MSLVFLAFAAGLTLSSCFFGLLHDGGDGDAAPPSQPVTTGKDYTGFRVTITGLAAAKARAARTASVRAPSKSVFPAGLDLVAASYEISGSGPSGAVCSGTTASGTWDSGPVAKGTWTVNVTARNSGGVVIGGGSVTVTVVEGTTAAPVTILPFNPGGNGTFSLNLNWSAIAASVPSPSVDAVLEPKAGGSSIPLVLTPAGSAASWSGPVASGFYLLTVKILNADTTVVYSAAEAVMVRQGYTTTATYVAAAVQPNLAPDLTYSIKGGAFVPGAVLRLSSASAVGTKIRYTTDGATIPTTTVGTLYTGPIALADGMVVKAIAYNALGTKSGSYSFVASDAIYVTLTNGDDLDTGTITGPLKSIQAGLNQAANQPVGTEVRVETEIYNESIVMTDGAKLLGGYAMGFGSRDPAANVTTISDPSTAAGTSGSPNRAVYFPPALTSHTEIDGFMIHGSVAGSCQYSSGIFVNGASDLTIRYCDVNGGTGLAETIGVFFSGSSGTGGPFLDSSTVIGTTANLSASTIGVKIQNCTNGNATYLGDNVSLRGGDAGMLQSGTAVGVLVVSSGPSIHNNSYIGGGDCNVSIGIDCETTDPALLIQNNTISGLGYLGGSINSIGVRFRNGALGTVDTNTITGGDNDTTFGLWIEGATPTVVGNTIGGGGGLTAATGVEFRNGANCTTFATNTITGRTSESGPAYGVSVGGWTSACSPVLHNNVITGGNSGGDFAANGMSVAGPFAAPVIGGTGLNESNDITGGTTGAFGAATGIRFLSSASGVVDKNTIKGSASTNGNAYGIWVDGATPEIRNAEISAGTSTAVLTIAGIHVQNTAGTGPWIHDNALIEGGSTGASGGCYAIFFNSGSQASIVERNYVFGSETYTGSYGIFIRPDTVAGTSIVIRNNVIQGGTVGNNMGISVQYASGASVTTNPRIYNNTVYGGPANGASISAGLFLMGFPGGATPAASPDVKNNILFAVGATSSYGVHAGTNNGSSVPQDLDNNCIYGLTALYNVSGTTYATNAAMNAGVVTPGGTTYNVGQGLNPSTVSIFQGGTTLPATRAAFIAFNWRLTAAAAIELREGALDLGGTGFTTDLSGAARTTGGTPPAGGSGWSMGAFEF